MYTLTWTPTAHAVFDNLQTNSSQAKRFKAVRKALRLLSDNPRHPSLNTHQWHGARCPHGDKLWEAYAENNTPGAYRIFFCYPPNEPGTICVIAITPHP
jgi:hypothetical protein